MNGEKYVMVSTLSRTLRVLMLAAFASALFIVPNASASLPVIYSSAAALPYIAQPNKAPAGANDWNCKPSAAHPRPVVLVHGTGANQGENWATLSPLLKNNGYCVFSLTYGEYTASLGLIYGIAPVANSAAELGAFVDRVRSATGSSKVDIVGHSQGGMMPNYYIKFLGGGPKVNTLVGLAPDNHGSDVDGLLHLANLISAAFPPLSNAIYGALNAGAPAFPDQKFDSAFIKKLNSVPDTVPGINYTVISSKYDEVATPWQSQFLSGGGGTIKNIKIQDKCALDLTDHLAIAYDHVAAREVLNALDPAHARSTICTLVSPFLGG
jgi:triacylglycerol esterase/lipase EstA (alpha/beta hydrolase family)